MRIRYDPTIDVLYIRLSESAVEDSDEISEGVILDIDKNGKPVGIEILDAARVMGGKEMKVELAIASSEQG